MEKKPCKICGKSFTEVKRHEEIHKEKEKSYQCEYCTIPVKNKRGLNSHMRNVHKINGTIKMRKKRPEENFNCNLCIKTYRRAQGHKKV